MIKKNLKKISASLFTGLMFCASLPLLGANGYSSFCCDPCACSNQFWVDAEYLYWQMKNSPEPVVLVSEAPAVPVTIDTATPVIGGGSIQNNWRSGGRFALGYWFDEARCFGIDANYLFLPKVTKSKTVSSDGTADSLVLISPFTDAITGATVFDNYIALPGSYSGVATRKVHNWMQGAELNGVARFACGCSLNATALVGFRYWNFDEKLTFNTSSPFIDVPTSVFQTFDTFNAQNNFYGGQIGGSLDYSYDCFTVNAKVKVALGAMCERLNISGETLTNQFDANGTVQEFVGGYFALPSNIGNHSKTNFAVIPEVNINFGYQFTENFRVNVGYTFLYVSNMLYAGNQIDSVINSSQSVEYTLDPAATLVGVASPAANLRTSSFWAQGVNVGLVFEF